MKYTVSSQNIFRSNRIVSGPALTSSESIIRGDHKSEDLHWEPLSFVSPAFDPR